jgi:hypothetical protein
MNKIKAIAIYPLLLLVDVGIYLTLGCHWKTARQYSNNKLLQLWERGKKSQKNSPHKRKF